MPLRHLILVLGDQLDAESSAFDGFEPSGDAVWMAEVPAESEYVWSTKPRIAMFLAGMRHYRNAARDAGRTVHYRQLDGRDPAPDLAAALKRDIKRLEPKRLLVVEPGEYRVRELLTTAAREAGCELEVRPDRSFLCTHEQFAEHAAGRKQLRMEYFYRQMRRRHGVLLDGDQPEGGKWNYDAANRGSFGRDGPGHVPRPASFPPDETTREVLRLVNERFADHPGSLDAFDWPVTPADASAALGDFVQHRLPLFGTYQDAMWTDQPVLYHARLSAAINLKLLSPRRAIEAAGRAYTDGRAPLESAEGFIRQLLGWREYVRGVYWRFMPEYLDRNALGAAADLPAFYWTGETDAACLRAAIGQTLALGYAHHIQRLMVTGLYALLLGVRPRAVHEWYLAVYVDAVEWVELPNTLGMSQYADGGVMASKPYAASGKYIDRMSDYCRRCPYRPAEATGDRACPFTTLYWDFLLRNADALASVPRMAMQLRNLDRLDKDRRREIRRAADGIRRG